MFEKLAAGMTTLEYHATPVLPFLDQAMKQHMLPARSKEITFELLPSPGFTSCVIFNVDPIKLATVFRNIFSNAIKFTKKQGRVTVRVEIKHRGPTPMIKSRDSSFVVPNDDTVEGDTIEITVQDTGAGLSAANLGKLFGEGVQFNANGLQGGGGSGLGLFITKGSWSFSFTSSLSPLFSNLVSSSIWFIVASFDILFVIDIFIICIYY